MEESDAFETKGNVHLRLLGGDLRKVTRFVVLVLAALLAAEFLQVLSAQEEAVTNPVAGNSAAIKEGASLFRANCSPCHGLNATGGGRGPDLSANRWTHGATDANIFRTITQGVPGTQMPAKRFEDSEVWAIIAYLRSLAPPKQSVSGDIAKGEKSFSSKGCPQCHMIKGRGGLLGPDLSRVGASRSAAYLMDSIRDPSKDLSDGMLDPNNHWGLPLVYDTVTLVTMSGQKITGVAKNEDTFSIQLLDTDQNLQFFAKKDLRQVIHERKSLMPAYSERVLSADALRDLVAYLQSLRGD
ncbi:MAG: c-type cytochrome [Candidatus Sulfotelmatobacter sp.]